ncbi:MAG TPA: hypothetical protein EYP14_10195 [Planctomycetaceae bacterium]|nr:hypothetical protein [Planctomycetaceae bacterium]
MSLILVISILLRLFALSWLWFRLRGRRDWRVRMLGFVLVLMALRQILALYSDVAASGHWALMIAGEAAEVPALVASVIVFFIVLSLETVILLEQQPERDADGAQRPVHRPWVWISMGVGASAMLLSLAVGYLAYSDSRKAILRAVATPASVILAGKGS